MIRIREALAVEGKYDEMRLRQAVDTLIIPTGGFRIFQDAERVAWLRRVARDRGLIILTDSDGAGLLIRSYLQKVLPPQQIRQAYIPPVPGKERRKTAPSTEGLLGVEGLPADVLLAALRRAGAHIEGEQTALPFEVTPAQLYRDGLAGRPGSSSLRACFLRQLGLPAHITPKQLSQTLRFAVTPEEYGRALAAARDFLKKSGQSG